MPTIRVFCWCGELLDEKGECPRHPPDVLAQGSERLAETPEWAAGVSANLEGLANMPGFAAEQRRETESSRILKCPSCQSIRCTADPGEQICCKGPPMRELQLQAASSEAEDVRVTWSRIQSQRWHRSAILAMIAAGVTGWVLAVAGWLR